MNRQQDIKPAEDIIIGAQLRWASKVIEQALPNQGTALLDSKILLCHCLDCDTTYLHTWPEKQLTTVQYRQFQRLVAKRCEGLPIAHLVGYRDFWTLRLLVSNATLIPRPETELVVECVLELPLPSQANVLDLGTGTGAIALALASEKVTWRIMGIDKSIDAIELAKRNATFNQLESVIFKQSDWFSNIGQQYFDLIVSNPPYVEQQSPYLTQGDVRFEPLSALISGDDGLDDIRLIVQQARAYLNYGGWLLLEHGSTQDKEIRKIFESNAYVDIQTVYDLNDLARVTLGKFSGISLEAGENS